MYFNRTNDILFKYLFGREEQKAALLSFINSVLSDGDEDLICDLELVDRELDPQHVLDKQYRLDIVGKASDGTMFDIEIQTSNEHDIDRRSLCYWARLYESQMVKGMRYRQLRPAIMINVMTFRFFSDEEYLNRFKIMNCRSLKPLNDDLQLYFIELPKWNGLSRKAKNRLERWLAFLCNDNPAEVEEIAMMDPVIQATLRAEKKFISDEAARYLYDMRERYITDRISEIAAVREDSLAEGREEGRKETAKILIKRGAADDLIQEACGLSTEEIQKLKNEIVD